MLPGIFRTDDPSVRVVLPPEGRVALEAILANLPPAVFTSDDGLGWVYQFWQSKKKKEVSGSGRKIEGLDLAAYSQLFTEHYMVQFLLENSLGAWWAARHPDSPLVKGFTYLRFRDDSTPAAGVFPGWPDRPAEVTVMDPCCGSGHFLVAAFEMLRRMRMEEEGLGEREAADAVLRDNLFGLEIDPRCVQIAAFALALAAWKTGGYRPLPLPNVACSGIPVSSQLEEWTKLAGDDANLKHTLERLYHLFSNAPHLGSLINPTDVPLRDRMFAPDFTKVGLLLERALAKEYGNGDPVAAVFGEAARGVARAASLLARQYTLVATNVPYLVRNKQGDILKGYIDEHYRAARADLATAFLQRCLEFCASNGALAVVMPQNWLAQRRYEMLRRQMLKHVTWEFLGRLGPGAFETISGEIVNVALFVARVAPPQSTHALYGLDATHVPTPSQKCKALREATISIGDQQAQLRNPDARISLSEYNSTRSLSEFADCPRGIVTGDGARWIRWFWELAEVPNNWVGQQSTVQETVPYGGREHVVYWGTRGRGMLRPGVDNVAYGRCGVAVSQMGTLPVTLYCGDLYDNNTAAIVPKDPAHLPALWAFCKSPEFNVAVRRIDTALKVTNAVFLKVPFDLERWKKAAEDTGPLPEPYSNDPTQWLFKGNPADSTEPLQVAVARLLGYHWPQQEPDRLSALADEDGIVPLSPVAGEEPVVERLRRLLAAAYGDEWSPAQQEHLLATAGFGGKGLEEWLRDGFFEQHCRLFHNRPFIWHIWDGRRDGFSVLVNCHKLDAARLDKLIYTYLGDWIRTQRAARDAGTPGADARLVAALELQKKLEATRDGEPPYDIYVRWKPLHRQPIGWNPDLNDGVRLNIRPFVTAGVLRSRFTINWNKDRGTNPDGSERRNDLHFTNVEKQAARKTAGATA